MAAQKTAANWSAQLLVVLCCACADDPTTPAGFNIEPAITELRVGSFQQLHVTGTDEAVTWSTSDTTIARINASGMLRVAVSYTACGWVTPGDCQVDVVAKSGSLVATHTFTIIPFEPTVQLASSRLDLEMGDSARVRPTITLEGMSVPWCTVSFASQDSSVARVGAKTGVVIGNDEGTTIVDVVISGQLCPAAPAKVQVTVRPPLYTLAILPSDNQTFMMPGDSVHLFAHVTNWKGVTYPALFLQWSSSNPNVVSVVDGVVIAHPCEGGSDVCQAIITARSGKLIARRVVVVR